MNDTIQLDQIIANLRAIRPEMKLMADAVTTTQLRDVTRYIETADLRSCKQIIDALIIRVSDELGCAVELEDAACVLDDAISKGIEE